MMNFWSDLKSGFRSLARAKGLTATIVLTLALGIGANAAIFALVRGVLLRPLVNRDEEQLLYIRQAARNMEDAAFSVPEIRDLQQRVKTISKFGDFSVIGFTMIGLGEPREVRSGVVSGTYFDVMGLHPVLGRLLNQRDDGPNAAGAVVLTYRFWKTVLKGDPGVLGKKVRLSDRMATVVGVLEPCVPYPSETEIIANIVTSPHHLSATMVTGRVHRMTELFGRLAPGATLEQARSELRTVYARMLKDHPEAYPAKAEFHISAVRLRDQITSRAKTVLWVLQLASLLVFVIACSNVANLILARAVRREGELAIRAALGASTAVLRRNLLAESLLLCVTGSVLGVLIAQPMVAILARYASRFSIRALDLTVDSSMLWVSALLAMIAAVLLAFVPRLPSSTGSSGTALGGSGVRVAGGANRRLRIFAVTQIAASFVLLAGASMLLKTLISLETTQTGFEMKRVLAINVPIVSYQRKPEQITGFYNEVVRRIKELPGVDAVAAGSQIPWRDAGSFGAGFNFSVDGHSHPAGEEDPRGQWRIVSPGFFATLGVPILAGRDFDASDRSSSEPVVIVSRSLARAMFPNQDAVNHHMQWTDPVMKFIDVSATPRRIIGVTADVDDENVVPGAPITIYSPLEQQPWGGRLFVHVRSNPYSLVPKITHIVHDLAADQPVEHAATLEDVRAEVLAPNRLNTIVFGGFAIVALLIALVGVAGVLAFSVSGRTREFGVRLAVGSQPRNLLTGVIKEGVVIAASGVIAGAVFGFLLARIAGSYFLQVQLPGALAVFSSIVLLLAAAVVASVVPAARAARIDVMQALRSE
jgi:putative ABC transport system permease protein